MDFSLIRQVNSPSGVVISIHSGDTLLWKKGSLPVGYQQLSYIETDGSQYIDTGVPASSFNDGLCYEFLGQITDYVQKNGHNYLFGCLNDSKRSGNVSFNTSEGLQKTAVYLGKTGSPIWITNLPSTGSDFSLRVCATSTAPETVTATQNDIPFTRTSFTATACEMPSANIYLLWCNGVGATSLPFWGRIYSFTMTNAAGDPIRSFLPCRRIPDDTIGLYDTVEGIFYENAGTGSFVAGEVL